MKKVIIITGAGAGIGKACSEYFLKKIITLLYWEGIETN